MSQLYIFELLARFVTFVVPKIIINYSQHNEATILSYERISEYHKYLHEPPTLLS
jgi:hypothetical protein